MLQSDMEEEGSSGEAVEQNYFLIPSIAQTKLASSSSSVSIGSANKPIKRNQISARSSSSSSSGNNNNNKLLLLLSLSPSRGSSNDPNTLDSTNQKNTFGVPSEMVDRSKSVRADPIAFQSQCENNNHHFNTNQKLNLHKQQQQQQHKQRQHKQQFNFNFYSNFLKTIAKKSLLALATFKLTTSTSTTSTTTSTTTTTTTTTSSAYIFSLLSILLKYLLICCCFIIALSSLLLLILYLNDFTVNNQMISNSKSLFLNSNKKQQQQQQQLLLSDGEKQNNLVKRKDITNNPEDSNAIEGERYKSQRARHKRSTSSSSSSSSSLVSFESTRRQQPLQVNSVPAKTTHNLSIKMPPPRPAASIGNGGGDGSRKSGNNHSNPDRSTYWNGHSKNRLRQQQENYNSIAGVSNSKGTESLMKQQQQQPQEQKGGESIIILYNNNDNKTSNNNNSNNNNNNRVIIQHSQSSLPDLTERFATGFNSAGSGANNSDDNSSSASASLSYSTNNRGTMTNNNITTNQIQSPTSSFSLQDNGQWIPIVNRFNVLGSTSSSSSSGTTNNNYNSFNTGTVSLTNNNNHLDRTGSHRRPFSSSTSTSTSNSNNDNNNHNNNNNRPSPTTLSPSLNQQTASNHLLMVPASTNMQLDYMNSFEGSYIPLDHSSIRNQPAQQVHNHQHQHYHHHHNNNNRANYNLRNRDSYYNRANNNNNNMHWQRRPRLNHQLHAQPKYEPHHHHNHYRANHHAHQAMGTKMYKKVLLCDKTLVSLDYIKNVAIVAEPRPMSHYFYGGDEFDSLDDNVINLDSRLRPHIVHPNNLDRSSTTNNNLTTSDGIVVAGSELHNNNNITLPEIKPPLPSELPAVNRVLLSTRTMDSNDNNILISSSSSPDSINISSDNNNEIDSESLASSAHRRSSYPYLLSDDDPLVRCDMWDLEKGLKNRKPPAEILHMAIRADFDTVRDAINRCRQLSEKILPNDNDEQFRDGIEIMSTEDLISLFSIKRGLLPGTKWCGLGDQANSYNDLGPKHRIDICCRAHDHCPIRLKPFRNDYGVLNIALYTKSHCDCDADFYRCLREVHSRTADMLGNLYFNVMKLQCMREERMKICREMKPIALGFERCVRYEESPIKRVFRFTTPPVAY